MTHKLTAETTGPERSTVEVRVARCVLLGECKTGTAGLFVTDSACSADDIKRTQTRKCETRGTSAEPDQL